MVTKFRWDGRLMKLLEVSVDMLLVFLGFFTVIGVGHQIDLSFHALNFFQIRDLAISNFTYLVLALIFFRVYNTSVLTRNYLPTIISVFFSLIFANFVLVIILFFIPDLSFTKLVLVFTVLLQFIYIAVWKAILVQYIQKKNIKNVIVFGKEDEVEELTKKLLVEFHGLINIKYIFIQNNGNYRQVIDFLGHVDQIYISPGVTERAKNKIVNYCLGIRGVDALLVPKTYEISLLNAKAVQLRDILTLQISSLHLSLEELIIKRVFDFIVSFIGLIVLFPLLFVIGILVKAHDGGDVFFRQERVTQDNKRFMIYKFRTMIVDAEKHTGAVQASENDDRITPIGKFLRTSRIDEIPQLINVLKGEMSLVGPRALRVEEVEAFEENNSNFKFRAHVKAGMTGVAQTNGNYATTANDKLRLDLLYIRNFSFLNDLSIILHTIRVVFDKESSKGISEDVSLKEYLTQYGYNQLETKLENAIKLDKVVEK
jgi:exopolysaccharide biosynthesis polyprenyl glycosylphosphotransferase